MTGDRAGGLASQLISNSSLPTQPMRCLSLHRVLGPLLFTNSSVDSFTSYQWKCCERGPLDLKQRQHILLSYFKTLKVGTRGTGTRVHRLEVWPWLLIGWIALFTGLKSIQWITQLVSLIRIRWIVISPMDSAIQRLNNQGLGVVDNGTQQIELPVGGLIMYLINVDFVTQLPCLDP